MSDVIFEARQVSGLRRGVFNARKAGNLRSGVSETRQAGSLRSGGLGTGQVSSLRHGRFGKRAFGLEEISFQLPGGYIMGLIGKNLSV